MKKILYILLCVVSANGFAQDFDKNLATARTSYGSGDLENSRFAMEQMLHDLDVAIGKEILKLLPATVANLKADEKSDNVNGGTGLGLFVQRSYGVDPKKASVEVVNNSPMINSINAFLSMPMLGGMMQNENQKQVKIQGYKSILNKSVDSESGKTSYELQIPMNNTLITVKIADSNEGEITTAGNALPLSKIAAIAQ
jgi:hypothetical protein